MRTVLITNGNLLSMLSLGDWLRAYGRSLSAIYVTKNLPSQKSNVAGVLRLLRRSGWDYTYFKLWVNVIAPPRLRREGLPASVADFVARCGFDVPVRPVVNVNADATVEEIDRLAPEYLISFSATQRFRRPLIETARRAAINTHWAALPAYAGLSPYFWYLRNGEPRFGVTLHRIDLKLDAGPIIDQVFGDMSDARTVMDVVLRMADCVSPMLRRFFDGGADLAHLRPQDPAGRSYFGHPGREDMRELRRGGARMMTRGSQRRLMDRVEALTRRCFDGISLAERPQPFQG